jgi:hypothetical protein
MPFVTQEHREHIDFTFPGDRCYFYYKDLVGAWKEEPRWTTAHNLYKFVIEQRLKDGPDDRAARDLAWQVFFQLYVMPYELEKRAANGDI